MSENEWFYGEKNPIQTSSIMHGNINLDNMRTVGDTYTTRESFKAFHTSGKYVGAHESYGATIADKDRYFYSNREPVGVWWVKRIAYDIWDNWFRVVNIKQPDEEAFNRKTQKQLLKLKASIELPRETVFERRYGTAILLCSYTGFGDETNWETPLFTLNPDGTPPKKLKNNAKLLQITPYDWLKVSVNEVDNNTSSIRYGLPEFYDIDTGADNTTGTNPGTQADTNIRVHWTRVIHDAPRLDNHSYEGVSAIDAIFDDLVGGRNARWGAYETYYRHGTGFPVIKTNATAAQNAAWIAAGGLDDYLNVRGYFMCGTDEDFKFVGAEGAVLNPNTYFDMYFTFIAAATGVAKDSIQGVSAGRVTGSEVNERQYYKSITLQQNQKRPMLRELISRLIQTGQITDAPSDWVVEWVDPFEVNPQDKAAIEFMETRTLALKTHLTINEKREIDGLDPHPDGDVLASLPGQVTSGSEPAPNQNEPTRSETEPEEEPNESTLLDTLTRS